MKMSFESRCGTASFKRAEQLRQWEESATNREPVTNKQRSRKIKFSSGCVFLAACAAGEKEEVLQLLEKGADVDTTNVDGLTALHQACIDDNLDMVEFLVEHGSDVNRGDNEGWTPLHATVSCGFISIAKYLLEHGANVGAVNCDGELALDIVESKEMEVLIRQEIDLRRIDCEYARNEEKRLMLQDAEDWLQSKSKHVDEASPKTGATPLHVASAKGYLDVIKLLLQCGADVDKQDADGWTPLHAAAHWGQREAVELLVDSFTDMDAKNFAGQTPFDVSDSEMFHYMEDLRKKQNKDEVNRRLAKKKFKNPDKTVDVETPKKIKMALEMQEDKLNVYNIEKKNKVNANMDTIHIHDAEVKEEEMQNEALLTNAAVNNEESEENKPTWRRPVPGRLPKLDTTIKTSNSFKSKEPSNEFEHQLRRTNSFQNDPEFYARYQALRARIQASSYPNYQNATYIIPPHPHQQQLSNKEEEATEIVEDLPSPTISDSSKSNKNNSSPIASPTTNSQPVRSGLNVTKTIAQSTNGSLVPAAPSSQSNRLAIIKNFFKSFVPPVRDEESETQRKAHAKRVRETRRSTQGVTLEEIKSAEQLVKKKNQTASGNNNEQSNGMTVSATITTATTTVPPKETPIADGKSVPGPPQAQPQERRPSWRLRVDNGSKFKLEDANAVEANPSTLPVFIRRPSNTSAPTQRPSSTPVDESPDSTVTVSLRRPKSFDEKSIDKEQDKENDARNAQATLATQAAIQRRRRPKRRSTGVVAFDNNEEVETDKEPLVSDDAMKYNNQESGGDKSSSQSLRITGASDFSIRDENGDIDYKKLYEEARTDNDRLKDRLKKSDEELRDTKTTLEKLNTITSKNSLSELEKREKRAMERKLSEMEEELKQMELLKKENQRLKDENGALIRVISKLSK